MVALYHKILLFIFRIRLAVFWEQKLVVQHQHTIRLAVFSELALAHRHQFRIRYLHYFALAVSRDAICAKPCAG